MVSAGDNSMSHVVLARSLARMRERRENKQAHDENIRIYVYTKYVLYVLEVRIPGIYICTSRRNGHRKNHLEERAHTRAKSMSIDEQWERWKPYMRDTNKKEGISIPG